MNTPDSTESNVIHPVGNTVPNPAYPVPPGGLTPDLKLAQWPAQQGASIQVMPDPGKPDPINYQLVGDPTMGGYEPGNPAPPAPNLAGVDGWPPPVSALAPGAHMFPGVSSSPIAPQYGQPDRSEPSLQTANLADDGISFEPRKEFDPDPAHPDLSSYNHPYGLAFHNTGGVADLFKPDPVLADLTRPDIPANAGGQGRAVAPTVRNLRAPDPLVPDLQNPQLEQAVHMLDRPGDLAPDALSVVKTDPTAQSALDVPYNQSFADASGMNSTRRRHFDLMIKGLQSEEQ